MSFPRMTLAGFIVVIAIIGVDFGLLVALGRFNEQLPEGLGLTLFLFETGAYLGWRSIGRRRTFWLAFSLLGTITALSFVWGMLDPKVLGLSYENGEMVMNVKEGCLCYDLWRWYLDKIMDPVITVLRRWHFNDDALDRFPLSGLLYLIWALPQVTIATLGGAIAVGFSTWLARYRRSALVSEGVDGSSRNDTPPIAMELT